MRRRAAMLAALVTLAMVAASGVALADSISGNASNERLAGTNGKDHISGAGGNDDLFGKGGADRLFGDGGNDDVFGGDRGDALQGGLGADDLFGQKGRDFVNAIDGQANDSVDCGPGFDVAGFDDLSQVNRGADDVDLESCEIVYVPVIGGFPTSQSLESGSQTALRNITTVEQAEQAVDDGLLRKVEG